MPTNSSHNPSPSITKFRTTLPAYKYREQFLSLLEENQIIILSGETGSGKTTQLPQYLLEKAMEESKFENIVVTQPRRLTTIGVGTRVAEEVGCELGSTVGYQIRLDKKVSQDTRILYLTAGVLLRKLALDGDLEGVTTVFIDEAHERSLDSDFLLVILKELVRKRPDLKVVVMSATLDSTNFKEYFNEFDRVAELGIEGRMFPVEENYLENVIDLVGATTQDFSEQGNQSRGSRNFRGRKRKETAPSETNQNWVHGDGSIGFTYSGSERSKNVIIDGFKEKEPPYGVIQKLIKNIVNSDRGEDSANAILCFLPGWGEIKKLHELLQGDRSPEVSSLDIHILHSLVSSEQQRKVFLPSPYGTRKLVLSTNIAESSITLNDVRFVIDSGLVREKTHDHETNIGVLTSALASKDRLKQRKGRAGRVQHGEYFCLLPEKLAKFGLEEFSPPEMLTTSLEQLCLQTRALQLADETEDGCKNFLSKALTPPEEKSVENAIELLLNLNAMKNENGKQDLTWFGRKISMLPLPPQVAKTLYLSTVFKCVDPVLTLVSIMSQKNIFYTPMDKGLQRLADERKLAMSEGHPTDHFTILNAYDKWMNHPRRYDFARENFLSNAQLLKVKDLKRQLLTSLEVDATGDNYRKLNERSHDWPVVKACLVSGLMGDLNLLKITPKTRMSLFYARKHGKVSLHKNSVIAQQLKNIDFVHKYLFYFDSMKTDMGVNIYDASQISPFPVAFFASDVQMKENYTASKEVPAEKSEMEQLVEFLVAKEGDKAQLSALNRKLKAVDPDFKQRVGSSKVFLAQSGYELFKLDRKQYVRKAREYGLGSGEFLDIKEWVQYKLENRDDFELLRDAKERFDVCLQILLEPHRHSQKIVRECQQYVDLVADIIIEDSESDDISASQNFQRPKKPKYYNSR
eukprot:maker-scaffold_35-snap-gene-2.97-mRNA-1 protein AED:0.20 eAED:0.20 QI:0/0/0/1/1/1/2/0/914